MINIYLVTTTFQDKFGLIKIEQGFLSSRFMIGYVIFSVIFLF